MTYFLAHPSSPIITHPKIKKDIRDKLMEAKKLRQAQMLEKMNKIKNEDLPDDKVSSGGGVIILN